MSDTDHQPSRTRVPMPVAALSDPHMGDAAKNPDRTEKIIGLILFLSIVFFAVAGAAYCRTGARGPSGARSAPACSPSGFGLTAWGKYLMPQGPFVEERHTLASTPEERDTMSAALVERSAVVVKRRKMLGGLFAAGAGGLRDRGRLPADPLARPAARDLPGDHRLAQGHGPGGLERPSGAQGHPGRRRHHDRLPPGHGRPPDRLHHRPGAGGRPDRADQGVGPALHDRAGTRELDPRRLRRLLQALHPPRLPRGPLRAGARAAGLPLPPVDVQRAQRRRARSSDRRRGRCPRCTSATTTTGT